MADSRVFFDSAEWDRYLKKTKQKIENIYPALKAAVSSMGFQNIIDHFEREENPRGRWAKLKYRKGKPLQDTGTLRNSFLPGRGKTERVGKASILMFTEIDYAGIHNKGKGRMHREFMWLSDEAKELILKNIMNVTFK